MLYELLENAGVNINDLYNSFKIMGTGMAGIFIVMVVIALIVFITTKIPAKKN